jgi:hypothetical protein
MADNAGAMATVERMLEAIRELEGFPDEAVAAIERAGTAAIRADLEAGRDPGTGKAWAPTKTGERAMKGAPAALQVKRAGTRITWSVGAPYVFHHVGVRGADPRPVVPDKVSLSLGNRVRLGLMPLWKKKTEVA